MQKFPAEQMNRSINRITSTPVNPLTDRHHQPVCHAWLMNVQCIIYFSFLAVGADPYLAEACSAILQHFSPITQTVYEICVTKIFHFLALGLTPGPKFTKKGDDLLPTQVYHPAKFHCPASTHAGDIRYKILRTNTQTQKETVSDICPACLSACGDNINKTTTGING